jgi:hypothetical protein
MDAAFWNCYVRNMLQFPSSVFPCWTLGVALVWCKLIKRYENPCLLNLQWACDLDCMLCEKRWANKQPLFAVRVTINIFQYWGLPSWMLSQRSLLKSSVVDVITEITTEVFRHGCYHRDHYWSLPSWMLSQITTEVFRRECYHTDHYWSLPLWMLSYRWLLKSSRECYHTDHYWSLPSWMLSYRWLQISYVQLLSCIQAWNDQSVSSSCSQVDAAQHWAQRSNESVFLSTECLLVRDLMRNDDTVMPLYPRCNPHQHYCTICPRFAQMKIEHRCRFP